jgi:hypothetical protein
MNGGMMADEEKVWKRKRKSEIFEEKGNVKS